MEGTLHDMAADAIGLLDALSISRAHVVGRSMSGLIAQILASEYPERVLSLISIMSSTSNPTLPQVAPDVMANMKLPASDPSSDLPEFVAHSFAFARRTAGTDYRFDNEAHRFIVLEEAQRTYDPSGIGRQIAYCKGRLSR
jgi:pimeloyl-ACP methyl ester carboxylesterase